MRMSGKIAIFILASACFFSPLASAQNLNFKEIEARVLEYRKWLDKVGSNGSRYWVRLDSSKRPHRLFVGEGFLKANTVEQEEFVEIFSRFLAGHPEKNMLIDIFDASSGKEIGEYGFGGFRLFAPVPQALSPR
jgi:hypothetical protein